MLAGDPRRALVPTNYGDAQVMFAIWIMGEARVKRQVKDRMPDKRSWKDTLILNAVAASRGGHGLVHVYYNCQHQTKGSFGCDAMEVRGSNVAVIIRCCGWELRVL